MARPEKPIDWKKVEEMLMANCHGTEISAYYDMHPDTFYRRVEEEYGMGFTAFSAEKKRKGDILLRQAQYSKAIKGDNTMLIWLGKLRLDQKDPEHTPSRTNITVNVNDTLATGISAERLSSPDNQSSQ